MSLRSIRLDPTQESAISSLQNRLSTRLSQLREIGALGSSEQANILRRRFDYSNVFGILGPRGAGKSTLLFNLCYKNGVEGPCSQTTELANLLFLDPVDCSTIPQGVEPGLAVLAHLENRIKKQIDRPRDPDEKEQLESSLEDLQGTLQPIYIRLHESYQALRLDLASSTQRFSTDLVGDVSDRLELSQKLADFLEKLALKIHFDALVIPLDDFDLVPASNIRKWLQSLLDELHQPRLFFVLAADFYRLQHLAWDTKAKFDDKTGRRLLDKILSWRNRVEVKPWSEENRRAFVHYPLDGDGKTGQSSMAALLTDTLSPPPYFSPLLLRLLPGMPRGLANVYDTLEFWLEERKKQGSEFAPTLLEFLAVLASGRSEPLLARALQETRLEDWEELLVLAKRELLPEGWREIVRIAQQRPVAQITLTRGAEPGVDGTDPVHVSCEPLRGLRVVSNWPFDRSGQSQESPQRGSSGPDEANHEYFGTNRVIIDPAGQDSTSHDPLRHQELWVHPLRDAEEEARPLWAEVLLTACFSAALDIGPNRAARNRASFLKSWFPAARRLEKCQTRARILPEELRKFFIDYRQQDLLPVLYWLRWSKQSTPLIGWRPLLSALRLDRDPLQHEILSAELNVDVRGLHGDLPSREPDQALSLIPDQVWAIVLLVDGLSQCPWSAFSARLDWSLATHLLVAGALVHGAYLYSMKQGDLLPEDALEAGQKDLLRALEQRSVASFVLTGSGALDHRGRSREEQSDEKHVFQRLAEVVGASIPSGDDPLGRAASSFQGLAPYQALQQIATKGWLY